MTGSPKTFDLEKEKEKLKIRVWWNSEGRQIQAFKAYSGKYYFTIVKESHPPKLCHFKCFPDYGITAHLAAKFGDPIPKEIKDDFL